MPETRTAPGEIEQWIVLHQRDGYDVGIETQQRFAEDYKWVRTELATAVCENIHELQSFRCEEAERRTNDEKTGEHTCRIEKA